MQPRDFCYWLQGYLELNEKPNLTAKQVEQIQEHLSLVFNAPVNPVTSVPNGMSPYLWTQGGQTIC